MSEIIKHELSPIMNWSGSAEVEQLSQPQFIEHIHSAGISTSFPMFLFNKKKTQPFMFYFEFRYKYFED